MKISIAQQVQTSQIGWLAVALAFAAVVSAGGCSRGTAAISDTATTSKRPTAAGDETTARTPARSGRIVAPKAHEHLATPVCRETRDRSAEHACWRLELLQGSEFASLSASCAVSSGGYLQCWTAGLRGPPEGQFAVVDDDGLDACAALVDGGAKCWGRGAWPRVPDSARFVSMTVGGSMVPDFAGIRACGLTEGGDLMCWGDGSRGGSGELFADGPFVEISIGTSGLAARRPDGQLENRYGPSPEDAKRFGEGPYVTFSKGGDCRVRESGKLECESSPYRGDPPENLGPVRLVRTGWMHGCALLESGKVRCWGDARPPPDLSFRYISHPDVSGSYCGITIDEQGYCWGDPSR